MKCLFTFLTLIFVTQNLWADYIIQNISDSCEGRNLIIDNNNHSNVFAFFIPSEYTCANGEFLPANIDECRACPLGRTCTGGTFYFDENVSQGISVDQRFTESQNNSCVKDLININTNNHSVLFARFTPNQYTCSAGYYLPANAIACVQCPANSFCAGGTFTYNETTDQGIVACSSGTFAPSGSAVCYPHILHVGDSNVYLKSTKQTTPSLNIKIGNDVFYANMTTVRTRMSKDSSHYLHVKTADNVHYYVCDDTTYTAE